MLNTKKAIEEIAADIISVPFEFGSLPANYLAATNVPRSGRHVYPARNVVFSVENIDQYLAFLPEKARKAHLRFLVLHEERHVYQSRNLQYLLATNYMNLDGHGNTPPEKEANEWVYKQARNPLEKAVFNLAKIVQELDGKFFLYDKDRRKLAKASGFVFLACAFTR